MVKDTVVLLLTQETRLEEIVQATIRELTGKKNQVHLHRDSSFPQWQKHWQLAIIDERILVDFLGNLYTFLSYLRREAPYIDFILLTDRQRASIEYPGSFEILHPDQMDTELPGLLTEMMQRKAGQRNRFLYQAITGLHEESQADLGLEQQITAIFEDVAAIGFERARIYFLSPDNSQLVGYGRDAGDQQPFFLERPVAQDPHMQQMIGNPGLFLVNKKGELVEVSGFTGKSHSGVSCLTLNGRSIGKISVDNQPSRRPIEPKELALLTRLVQGQLETLSARRRADQYKQLWQASLDLTASNDRSSLLETIIKQVTQLLQADGGGIYEYDGEKICIVADYKLERKGFCLKKGEGIAGQMLACGAPFELVNDHRNDPRRARQFESTAPAAVLFTLLKREDRILGLLFVESQQINFFNEEHVRLASNYTGQAAIALQNQEKLMEVEGRREAMRELFDLCPSGIISVGRDGRVSEINKKALDMVGLPMEELTKRHVRELYYDKDEAKTIGEELDRAPNQRIDRQRAQIRHFPDNRPVPIKVTVKKLTGGGSVGYSEDIAELEQIERRETLSHLAMDILARAENLESALKDVASEISSFLNADFCRIYLLHENKNQFDLIAAQGRDSGKKVLKRPFVSLNFEKRWLGGKIRRWLDKGIDFQRPINYLGLKKAPKSLIFMPFYFEKEIEGFLFVGEAKGQEPGFSQETVNLLETLAGQTSLLLHKLRINEQIRQSNKWLQGFLSSTEALISADSSKKMVEQIVNSINEAAGAQSASIFLLDAQGKVDSWWSTDQDNWPPPQEMIRRQGITNKVIQSRAPYVIEDANDKRYNFHPDIINKGIKAAICLPLMLKERCIGVLWLHYYKERVFSNGEQTTLKNFVNQAAIALDKARRWKGQQDMMVALEFLDRGETFEQIAEAIGLGMGLLGGTKDVGICLFKLSDGVIDRKYIRFNETAKRYEAEILVSESDLKLMLQKQFPSAEDTERREHAVFEHFGVWDLVAFDVHQDLVGVVFLFETEKPGKADQNAILAFAKRVGMALWRVLGLDQLKKTRDMIKTVGDMVVLEDYDQTMALLAREIKNLTHCDLVTIYPYDQARGMIDRPPIVAGQMNKPNEIWQGHDLSAKPLIQHTVEEGTARWEEQPSMGTILQESTFVASEGVKALALIPLQARDQTVGFLFVSFRSHHHFDNEEKTNLQLVANFAAMVIRNVNLYEQGQRQVRALDILHEAGSLVIPSLELEKTLQFMADMGYNLLHDDLTKTRGSVNIYLVAGPSFVLATSSPPEFTQRALIKELPIKPKKNQPSGLIVLAYQTKKSILVSDVQYNDQYLPQYEATQSNLVVPIIAGQMVIGGINCEAPTKNAFREEHVSIFEAFAAQVSIAIQAARLYGDLRNIKGYIGGRTAIDWISMVSHTWGHDIKREVATARTSLEILKLEPSLSEKARAKLEKLDQSLSRIKDVPLLAPLTSDDKTIQLAFNSFVEEEMHRLWEAKQTNATRLVLNLDRGLDKKARVVISKNWLSRLLEIIVDNCLRSLLEVPQETRALHLRTHAQDELVLLEIHDTGPGLAQKVRDRIFEEVIRKEDGGRGAGIGLMLARAIVETYGGRILAANHPAGGALFTIYFPMAPIKAGQKEEPILIERTHG